MNPPRFFSPQPLSAGSLVELSENAARHAVRVLRMGPGDALTLFDGRGGEYAARLARVARERAAAEVLQWRDQECESPLTVTLVQALQGGDKMDLSVQKAVELGVRRIVPVATQRSVLRLSGERASRRVAHWRGVAVAACEQCGRNRVPLVEELQGLHHWLGLSAGTDVVRLALLPGAARGLQALPRPAAGTEIQLLIGAEGGLSPEEAELSVSAGFVSVHLGPRVLRTETAGLAALTAVQTLWGDLATATGDA